MSNRFSLVVILALSVPVILTSVAHAQAPAKKPVVSETDLPRFSYPVKGAASDLLQADDATFNAFAAKVRSDLEEVLKDYDIQDKSTLRNLLRGKSDLQMLAGDFEGALATIKTVRALQDKPSAKLLSGLTNQAMMEAAIDSKASSGPAFEASYRQHLQSAVTPLPWGIVQNDIKSTYAVGHVVSRTFILANVETDIDSSVKKSGALDGPEALQVISYRNQFAYFIPLEPVTLSVLKQYIASNTVVKPDIWAAREVTLTKDQKLTPVPVAIWDSGIDVSLFPDQLFTDPKPTVSGTHGLAYDDSGAPSQLWLYPISADEQKLYPEFRADSNGFRDLENGVDSPAAEQLEQKFKTMPLAKAHDLQEAEQKLGFYVHGTHCAGIAVRGNPAARLVVARFDDQLSEFKFRPTEAWVRRMGDDFQQMSAFFNTRHVRVVNMSWGDDPEEFELWLSKTGGGSDPAACKKEAASLYALWRTSVETAIKNAPNTLFVCAAGNSNGNAGFNQDVPASLHLPNLLAVAAVNGSGDETSFTSYGDTVFIDADGFEVESFVPGGAKLKLSGTSMATPNVVNLAAKLFALDPSLTPVQVIDLIKRGASASDDGRRHLIDEKKSVALLQETAKK